MPATFASQILPVPKAALLFAFLALAPLHAAPQKEKVPPPQPSIGRDVSLVVERGGSIDIVLKGIAMPGETVRFKTDKSPAHGSLSEQRRLSGDSVAYTYSHDNSKEAIFDRAVFKLKTGPRNAWGRITAAIEIREPQSRLAFEPNSLDFGQVPIGETRVKTLRIRNGGGGVLQGSLRLGIPWSIDGSLEFALAGGEERSFEVAFSPLGPEEQRGRLSIEMRTGQSAFIGLGGEGVYRFDIPGRIVFDQVPGDPAFEIPVTNLSGVARDLAVHAPPPLICEPALHLPAGGTASLKLSIQKKHYTERSVELSMRDGDAVRGVRVDLPPPPALLQWVAADGIFDLGDFPFRHSARAGLLLENRGSTAAEVEIRPAEGGLSLESDQPRRLNLQPGESAEIKTVWRLPEEPGEVSATLVATQGGLEHPVRVRARVLPLVASAPLKKHEPGGSTTDGRKSPRGTESIASGKPGDISPTDPEYKLENAWPYADALVSWKSKADKTVEFAIQRPVFRRGGAAGFFEKRMEVPETLPGEEDSVQWEDVPPAEARIVELPDGRWQGRVSGLREGWNAIRILAHRPGTSETYCMEIPVEVGKIPLPGYFKSALYSALIVCSVYLLYRKILRQRKKKNSPG